jgi:hypothetical protein
MLTWRVIGPLPAGGAAGAAGVATTTVLAALTLPEVSTAVTR